ncbi:RNA polymerase sigma factor [Aureliella helgolandensis]|uniref:RNA polymerase sigma factor n=1 Tax=Aureliella helgolandensis TaxID=2527968 RepID=UPI0028F44336|nr:DUF6596 domain-containing protein [Aureliella helgolandensis]
MLSVIYLIFDEGYSASSCDSLVRSGLSDEAIRLCRLLLELHSDAEVMGLLALMLLRESRRTARTSSDGQIVLLENQDRSLWNRDLIDEGKWLIEQSLELRRFGFYTLQAAISAVHADARASTETDWNQVVALYSVLIQVDPTPVFELNQAVAVAMRDVPDTGIAIIDAILEQGELVGYHLAQSARGELLRRAGRTAEAATAFEQALELTQQEPERRFLAKRLGILRGY